MKNILKKRLESQDTLLKMITVNVLRYLVSLFLIAMKLLEKVIYEFLI
jgi:hypothetical protein